MRFASTGWWLFVLGCSDAPIVHQEPDASDASVVVPDDSGVVEAAPPDASVEDASDGGNGCFVSTVGVFGTCMTTSACMALGDSVSTPGYCPGPSTIECCTDAPDVGDNPPVPTGWTLMQQSAVTPQMTTWAVSILQNPTMYPMWSTTTQTFGAQMVMARVEWHPPDFQNSAIHRGVTLYVPG